MNRRIFTFGCSFTQHIWPTWSDIILYKNYGFNFGLSGGGFDFILYRIFEVDRIYNLTKDDLIIIVFPTPIRMDFILNEIDPLNWSCNGQIISSPMSKYKDKIFSINGLIYKSFSNIHIIDNFLSSKNLTYYYGSMSDIFSNVGNYFENLELSDKTIDLINYTKDNIDFKLENFFDYLYPNCNNWPITKKFNDYSDYHPRPYQHYNWVKNVLLKNVDVNLKFNNDDLSDVETIIDNNDDVNKYKHDNSVLLKYLSNKTFANVYL